MSLVLAKMLHTYDFELLDKKMDWVAQSGHYVMWWKAPIRVRATKRSPDDGVVDGSRSD